jgi:phospholipase/carboxylesterase
VTGTVKRRKRDRDSFLPLFPDKRLSSNEIDVISGRNESRSRFPNRREFSALAGGTIAALFTGGFSSACAGWTDAAQFEDRITARPKKNGKTTASGETALGLDTDRDAVLRIPPNAGAGPLPLLVLFHGAGGSGANMLKRISAQCDDAGLAVLSPTSRDSSWDAIRGGFGPDVAFINRALSKTFDMVNVDPQRIVAGGFSDGATYALSLGLINGDYFKRLVAFSPGFIVEATPHGKPAIFISHGTDDQILPIDRCSRVIVPALKKRGYDVTFREFTGPHTVPPDVAKAALTWAAAK